MGIIRNHIKQMKVENYAEYLRLMEGYSSEDELVRDVCGLSTRAVNYARSLMNVAKNETKKRR
jgi:hypothetical protein